MANGARPVAGGSDLVVAARHGKAPLPGDLVAIDRLGELTSVSSDATTTTVGALLNHASIEVDPTLVSRFSALSDASALVGSPATRHVGTLGGNIMNASPAMDTGAPLVVFNAVVELRSLSGTRLVPVGELWSGPGRTTARPDELCTAVILPHQPERSGSAYVRLEYRRAMEIAVVGAAAAVTLDADGTIASATIALSAVAPTILSVTGTAGLTGLSVSAAAAAAASMAAEQATPISDLRASDVYRRHCVGVMASRALTAAAERAAGAPISIPANRSGAWS